MQFIVYLLFYPLLWLVSILPFRLLYFVSDCVYVLIYHIIGYRKKTVRANIAMAFPEKSASERLKIEKGSYHHLCDMFLEMAKTMTITDKEIEDRFRFTNLNDFKDCEREGKSIALLCGHYASYEWVVSMNRHATLQGYGIYKKIANKHFDRLVHKIRSKFKAALITTKETIPTIERNQQNGVLGVYGFASDQAPKATKIYHWGTFMGIESPIITGAEMLAKKYRMNVMFLRVRKLRRGYYEADFVRPFRNPSEVPDYQISDAFMAMVEEQIREAPEFYLWTHKRWKTKRADITPKTNR